MKKDGTWVGVAALPDCDLCGYPARVDGKTKQGPWAYMCPTCHEKHGVGLGTGLGQRLLLPGEEVPA